MSTKKAKNYQQLSDELDGLIEWFESDSVSLDEAADKYKQAIMLIQAMENHIKTAENKVKKIAASFDQS